MEQWIAQRRGGAFGPDVSVDPPARIARRAAAQQADDPVGGPARVADEPVEKEVPAPDRVVARLRPALEQVPDLARETGRDALVGVDDQYPWADGLVHRPVLLRRRSEVLALKDPDARNLPGEVEGRVGRERVDEEHLVGERHALEALLDVDRLVEARHDGRELFSRLIHRIVVPTEAREMGKWGQTYFPFSASPSRLEK